MRQPFQPIRQMTSSTMEPNITVFNTEAKEQKQAAWDFIKFLTNTENTAYFAAQTGYIPVRRSAQHAPVFAAVLMKTDQTALL